MITKNRRSTTIQANMVSLRTLQLFTGAFTLVNITRTDNGKSILDTIDGRHPVDTIIYSNDGYMPVLIHATEPEWRPLNLSMLD